MASAKAKKRAMGPTRHSSYLPTKEPDSVIGPTPPLPAPITLQARAAAHEPISFELLSAMAKLHGLTLRKQAGGLYYLIRNDKKFVENPYAGRTAIQTDFDRRDLEDYLLTI